MVASAELNFDSPIWTKIADHNSAKEIDFHQEDGLVQTNREIFIRFHNNWTSWLEDTELGMIQTVLIKMKLANVLQKL